MSWTLLRLARSEKTHNVIQLLPVERASKGRHVGAAVHDPDDDLIIRELVSNIGEIGTAMPAVSGNGVAVLAALGVKQLCALKDRSARGADDCRG